MWDCHVSIRATKQASVRAGDAAHDRSRVHVWQMLQCLISDIETREEAAKPSGCPCLESLTLTLRGRGLSEAVCRVLFPLVSSTCAPLETQHQEPGERQDINVDARLVLLHRTQPVQRPRRIQNPLGFHVRVATALSILSTDTEHRRAAMLCRRETTAANGIFRAMYRGEIAECRWAWPPMGDMEWAACRRCQALALPWDGGARKSDLLPVRSGGMRRLTVARRRHRLYKNHV